MRSPRRIFRSSLTARTGRVGRTMLVWSLAVVGTASLAMVGLSSDLFGRAPPGPDRLQADPGKVAVVGGDTLRLDGTVIRLAGVEAPNRGDTCGGGADCGGAATSALAGLVRDRRVECRLSGHDRLGRPYGACDANGMDLSSAIVASGWARAQHDRPGLADLELGRGGRVPGCGRPRLPVSGGWRAAGVGDAACAKVAFRPGLAILGLHGPPAPVGGKLR